MAREEKRRASLAGCILRHVVLGGFLALLAFAVGAAGFGDL